MKIVHLCLACFFPDGFSYQENLLPKYHKALGYEVEVIASLVSFNKDGQSVTLKPCKPYLNEYNIKVTRLDYKYNNKFCKKLKIYQNTYDRIKDAKPDILFIHGLQFWDIHEVVRYLKEHRNVSVFIDNHADFSNSAKNWLSLNIMHRFIWRHCAHTVNDYVKKFFGVLPARVDFLKNIYNLPETKCKLLVMGADDELVVSSREKEVRKCIRKKHNISDDDFLIITGGKIDQWKTETILLMKAVKNINAKVKLIVFGSIIPELKKEVNSLVDGNKIQYIGWIKAEESYSYFAASDLVVFPGRHSVMWEQVTGQGIPMLVKDWAGTHHVDLGGNVKFLKEVSVDEIKRNIEFLLKYPEEYRKMKHVAINKGMKKFSYMEIAKRSIED